VPSARRIIVGASGSPGSLRALRYAQQLARDLDGSMAPVLAWLPPDGDLADRRTPCEELRRIWAQDARLRLQDALNLPGETRPPICPSSLSSGAASPVRSWSTQPAAPVTCWLSGPAARVPWPGSRTDGSRRINAAAAQQTRTRRHPDLSIHRTRPIRRRGSRTTLPVPVGRAGTAAGRAVFLLLLSWRW
jgi:hypothetical protein